MGRPHTPGRIEEPLNRRTISVSTGPSKDDTIGCLRVSSSQDTNPEAAGDIPEGNVPEETFENTSGVSVAARILGTPL